MVSDMQFYFHYVYFYVFVNQVVMKSFYYIFNIIFPFFLYSFIENLGLLIMIEKRPWFEAFEYSIFGSGWNITSKKNNMSVNQGWSLGKALLFCSPKMWKAYKESLRIGKFDAIGLWLWRLFLPLFTRFGSFIPTPYGLVFLYTHWQNQGRCFCFFYYFLSTESYAKRYTKKWTLH